MPSRLLAWTAAGVALLVILGYTGFRSGWFDRSAAPATPEIVAPAEPSAAIAANPAQTAATPAGPGQVVLTATSPVWLRITDASKTKLFEREMAAGESYSVPMTAADPKILTGRPDALKVTVDGREVAPLGAAQQTVRDLAINAAALAARPPAPAASPGTTPVAAPPPPVAH